MKCHNCRTYKHNYITNYKGVRMCVDCKNLLKIEEKLSKIILKRNVYETQCKQFHNVTIML